MHLSNMKKMPKKILKVMNKYKITKILEDDYGCEDRPDDYTPRVIVYLKSKDIETTIKQVDLYLIDNDIDVGDMVVINSDGVLEKVSD